VHGGSGDDELFGDAGGDALYSGPGNDTIHSVGDFESDHVDCGSGIDAVFKGPDADLDRFVNCEKFVR
jgi:Ca2+-binding RTX toxin-like protein